jgi:MFS family permease
MRSIGTLVLSPLADREGRRDLLLVTMVITGLGSVLTAVVNNYTWFVSVLLIVGFLVLAAIIAQFGTSTRSRMLEEVSP